MPTDLLVADAAAWRAWLAEHHTEIDGVWLRLARKGDDGATALSYADALDEALCFGWIDGQARRVGDASLRRFTPRRARSIWSLRNIEHVERLRAAGLMHAAGEAEVERATADGRWAAAYAGPATMQVPADFAAAVAADPAAQAMYDVLTSQNRYAMLFRLANVKRAETRQRRIAEFVAILARGETIHPQKRQVGP